MGSNRLDDLLAELLSSDVEEQKQEEEVAAQQGPGNDEDVWDPPEGLFEDGDEELDRELARLQQELQQPAEGIDESLSKPPDAHESHGKSLDDKNLSEPSEKPGDELLEVGQVKDELQEIFQQPSPFLREVDGGQSSTKDSTKLQINAPGVSNYQKPTSKLASELTFEDTKFQEKMWSELYSPMASRAQLAAEQFLNSQSTELESRLTPKSNANEQALQDEIRATEELLRLDQETSKNAKESTPSLAGAEVLSRSLSRLEEEVEEDGTKETNQAISNKGSGLNSGSGNVPQWKQEFFEAEEATRLLAEGKEAGTTSGVTERLQEILGHALQEWNPQGRPDAQGGMIGGSAAIRVTNQQDGPLTTCLQNSVKYGNERAVCKSYHRPPGSQGFWYTAIGTSEGYVLVETTTYTGISTSQQPAVELLELRDGVGSEVTALNFSYSGDRERLLLVAGYMHGSLVVWDPAAKKMVATITGHAYPITSCCFLPNSLRTPSTILSADVSGAIFYHSLTSWVVRTGVNSKKISAKEKGPTLLSPLVPFTIPLRSGGERQMDSGASFIREDAVGVAGEGMICICAPGSCEVGRLCADGRLIMFYQLPAPAEYESHEIPYATWSPNFPGSQRSFSDSGVPGAQLAVGWIGSVTLFDVPVIGDWIRPGDAGLSEQGSRWNYRTTRPDPNETRTLIKGARRTPVSMMGLWSPGDSSTPSSTPFPAPEFPIINLHWMAPGQLGALRKQGMLSQFIVFNNHLDVVEQVEIDDWPRSWKTEYLGEVYSWPYAASAGMVSKFTMIGSLGLKVVRLMGWEECLEVMREIGKVKMGLHLGMHFFLQATQKALRGTNSRSAHLGTKDPALVARRLSHLLLEYLDKNLGEEYPSDEERCSAINEAARVATDLCILLNMTKALFQDIFPRFVSSGYEANFLQVLEQTIIRNELSEGVAPEVVQALVEHCCKSGEPDKVERCVLRMDIASLDLNQVIRLCLRHDLFVALLYIFSKALKDVTTPALHLMNAILDPPSPDHSEKYTLKLLVYLHCFLQQQSYPPGSGELPRDQDHHEREKIFGFLLFTSGQQLLDARKSMRDDFRRGSTSVEDDLTEAVAMRGSYPVLRCLLVNKPESTIWMLKESLSEWDSIEKDILEAWSGGHVEEMHSVRSVTQVVVDALTDLLKSDAIKNKAVIVEYVCESVGCSRALVTSEAVLELLEHLSTKAQKDPAELARVEKMFYDIVKSTGVQQHHVANYRPSALQLSPLQAQTALSLAFQAGMMQAAALLHHLSGNFHEALKAVLRDTSNLNAPFEYISKSLEDLVEGSKQMTAMRKAILTCMEDLVKMDPEAAALMVLKDFPHDHQAVIQGLQGTRPLLFKYLKSAMEAAFSDDVTGNYVDSLYGDMKNIDLSCLLTKEHCTMFMGLLCEFDPDSVLPFLKTRDHLVDIDQCKKWCVQYGIREGSAHILEREGDINGALEMYLKEIESDNMALEDAVESQNFALDFLNSGRISRQQSLGFLVQENFGMSSARHSQYVRDLPDVLKDARKSLHAAIGLCQRNSKQLGLSKAAMEKQGMPSREGPSIEHRAQMLEHWFSLLKEYVDRVRHISQQVAQSRTQSSTQDSQSITAPNTPISRQSLHTITHHELRSMGSSGSFMNHSPQIAFLHDLYTAFMKEIISAMADYVPLQDIVERIVIHHSHERFGDFRSILLGLMSAYNSEQNILESVHHMVNSDAYRALLRCYNCRKGPYDPIIDFGSHETAGNDIDGEDIFAEGAETDPSWSRVAVDERGDLILCPGGEKRPVPIRCRRAVAR